MPLDTREKRASAVMVTLPFRNILPLPDPGAEDQGDRQEIAFVAMSVLASGETPGQPAIKRMLWLSNLRAPANGWMW